MITANRSGLIGGAVLALMAGTGHAQAAPAPAGAAAGSTTPDIGEIVVTAQKRSEDINKVGMAITAKTGDQLIEQGIRSTADLAKIVPGFTYEGASGNQPVYSIRGIGFHDQSLASGQAVAIYADEVPMPFAMETIGADFDVARVEVLKGPQGTLFGENSTGGAVNYVSAKPTDTLKAGLDASYGRFNTSDISGFLSGPITDTLRARVAVRSVQGDGWQESYVAPAAGDPSSTTLGRTNRISGRVLVDWQPTPDLKVSLNANVRVDRSDTQAAQMIGLDPSSLSNPLVAGIVNFPTAPANDRAAAWDPGVDYAQNNRWHEETARIEYKLGAVTLTSITALQKYVRNAPAQEIDGTTYEDLQFGYLGNAKSFYQELRASGHFGALGNWIVGGNYEHDNTYDEAIYTNPLASTRILFGFPNPGSTTSSTNRISTDGIYANADYPVLTNLTAQGGVRYTKSSRTAAGCSADRGDGTFATIFGAIQYALTSFGLKTSPIVPIAPGGCVTLDATYTPSLITGSLDQNNVSWRAGLNWTAAPGTLIYANVSKGFKSGSFPLVAAASYVQYTPVTQEGLLAFEAGIKSSLFDHTLQLNASAFYYDYSNKQISGTYIDPIFGDLTKLVTIPKSRVIGFEASANWRPVPGLLINPAVTYADSKILGVFSNYDPKGVYASFAGESFTYSPKWQANTNVEYRWGVGRTLDAFVGGNASYQSSTNAAFGDLPIYYLKAYTLVDLRAGVESKSGTYRVSVWGSNVFNTYYWTNAQRGFDFDTRYAGRPASYGASLSYRFQ
jgi:outer membrane receptor protein involved in Fe transport